MRHGLAAREVPVGLYLVRQYWHVEAHLPLLPVDRAALCDKTSKAFLIAPVPASPASTATASCGSATALMRPGNRRDREPGGRCPRAASIPARTHALPRSASFTRRPALSRSRSSPSYRDGCAMTSRKG